MSNSRILGTIDRLLGVTSSGFTNFMGVPTGCIMKYSWSGDTIELPRRVIVGDIDRFDSAVEIIKKSYMTPSQVSASTLFYNSTNDIIRVMLETDTSLSYLVGRNKIILIGQRFEPIMFSTAIYSRKTQDFLYSTLHLSKRVLSSNQDPVSKFIKQYVLPQLEYTTYKHNVVIGDCMNICKDTTNLTRNIFNVDDKLANRVTDYGEEITRNLKLTDCEF